MATKIEMRITKPIAPAAESAYIKIDERLTKLTAAIVGLLLTVAGAIIIYVIINIRPGGG